MEVDLPYPRKVVKMSRSYRPTPFCECLEQRAPVLGSNLRGCQCGEQEDHEPEFRFVEAFGSPDSSSVVVISDADRHFLFHPVYSGGTALVWGDRPLECDRQYYWEVKMLSDMYGTDIMVGVGTRQVDIANCQHLFASLLGLNYEAYGLSYTGRVYHGGVVTHDTVGFCKGSLVGVLVDMWHGTLEFYINRKPMGVMFTNLHGHKRDLYPMISSTAAQSSMRLMYAGSRPVTLLTESVRTLASIRSGSLNVPPGLWNLVRGRLWKQFPVENNLIDAKKSTDDVNETELVPAVINNTLQTQYINRYYMENMEREFPVVVRE